jgi:hypothetical protein
LRGERQPAPARQHLLVRHSCICFAAQGFSTGSLALPMCGVTWPGPSRLPWKGWAGSCRIGPRPNPAAGSSQFTPSTSQANSADASSGICLFAVFGACASATAHAANRTPPAAIGLIPTRFTHTSLA